MWKSYRWRGVKTQQSWSTIGRSRPLCGGISRAGRALCSRDKEVLCCAFTLLNPVFPHLPPNSLFYHLCYYFSGCLWQPLRWVFPTLKHCTSWTGPFHWLLIVSADVCVNLLHLQMLWYRSISTDLLMIEPVKWKPQYSLLYTVLTRRARCVKLQVTIATILLHDVLPVNCHWIKLTALLLHLLTLVSKGFKPSCCMVSFSSVLFI